MVQAYIDSSSQSAPMQSKWGFEFSPGSLPGVEARFYCGCDRETPGNDAAPPTSDPVQVSVDETSRNTDLMSNALGLFFMCWLIACASVREACFVSCSPDVVAIGRQFFV